MTTSTSNFFTASGAALTSNDDTWTTPRSYFAQVSRSYNFTLDAAALTSSTLCDEWYGPDHPDPARRDALLCDWHADARGGDIWLNPPYGREMNIWMQKAYLEASKGSTVVCLVPSRTDTAWFHDFCMPHDVTYIRGRLKFGDGKNSAPFPSALVVMRPLETRTM